VYKQDSQALNDLQSENQKMKKQLDDLTRSLLIEAKDRHAETYVGVGEVKESDDEVPV